MIFKSLIAPLQKWLLSQHRCVGCGKNLEHGVKTKKNQRESFVRCSCGRVYVYTKSSKIYRRALIEEVHVKKT